MNFIPVPVAEVDRIWPQVSGGFEKAIARSTGDMNLGWLHQQCRTGSILLLVVVEDKAIIGAFALRPEQTRTGPVTRIVEMWGHDFRHWLDEATTAVRSIGKQFWNADRARWEGQRAHRRFVPGCKAIRYIYEV